MQQTNHRVESSATTSHPIESSDTNKSSCKEFSKLPYRESSYIGSHSVREFNLPCSCRDFCLLQASHSEDVIIQSFLKQCTIAYVYISKIQKNSALDLFLLSAEKKKDNLKKLQSWPMIGWIWSKHIQKEVIQISMKLRKILLTEFYID